MPTLIDWLSVANVVVLAVLAYLYWRLGSRYGEMVDIQSDVKDLQNRLVTIEEEREKANLVIEDVGWTKEVGGTVNFRVFNFGSADTAIESVRLKWKTPDGEWRERRAVQSKLYDERSYNLQPPTLRAGDGKHLEFLGWPDVDPEQIQDGSAHRLLVYPVRGEEVKANIPRPPD